MIKATDLRIGNIVSVWGTNGCPDGWKEINIIADNISTCVSHPEWFNGIVLTEEWLPKLGFKSHGYAWYHEKGNSLQAIVKKGGKIEIEIDFGWHSEGGTELMHIVNVHQVQNLIGILFLESKEDLIPMVVDCQSDYKRNVKITYVQRGIENQGCSASIEEI